MSNPLLQPDDRFRRREVPRDEAGRSAFSEDAAVDQTVLPNSSSSELYGGGAAGKETYQPTYETSVSSRGRSIFWLGVIGLIFAAVPWFFVIAPDWISFGVSGVILLTPLGCILSLVAVVQAFYELEGIRKGAIDNNTYSWCMVGLCAGGMALAIVGTGIFAIIFGSFM